MVFSDCFNGDIIYYDSRREIVIRVCVFVMGNCVARCIIPCFAKGGTEKVTSEANSILELKANDIDG